MASRTPEEIVNIVQQFKTSALQNFHVEGNCVQAKKLCSLIADCGIEYLDCQNEDETSKALAEVLMSTGKYLCTLMDYKQASYCFKTSFDVLSTCRNIEHEELQWPIGGKQS